MAPKVLVVLTSSDKLPKNGHPSGWYLPELSHPYDILSPKAELAFASPKGGKAPLDPASVKACQDGNDTGALAFLENHKDLWENTKPISDFLGKAASEYDALFFPGGHGPMIDLAVDKESQQLIREFWDAGKAVAAVCHGPIVFANVDLADGTPLIKGKKTTGFTNSEEDAGGLAHLMPFLLEDVFIEKGSNFEKAENWAAKVVVDGKLITGQNPASAKGVGEAIAKAIGV